MYLLLSVSQCYFIPLINIQQVFQLLFETIQVINMSLLSASQDKNAKRVCIQLFVFATGRTILASQPGASPTSSMTLWNPDPEDRVIFFAVSLPSFIAIDSRQPVK
jgi:hypothetical protein